MKYNFLKCWKVVVKRKVDKSIRKLPKRIQEQYELLVQDLMFSGPIIKWPNFSKLSGMCDTYHCHIKKGRPTYVVVWVVVDKKIKIIEVSYVGSHEKAQY
jgi:addiction module RelE/StbE family toxin